MDHDKLNDVFFSKIETDVNGDLVLPLPDEVVNRFNLTEGSELIIVIKDGKMVITKVQ